MRRAVLDVWGQDGLLDVARRVSPDCRALTVDAEAEPLAWVPERYLVEWHEATWEGPAQRDDDALCRTINRRLDLGFGHVRKALLGLVGPEGVIRRAGELWKHDHTHGRLEVGYERGAKSVLGTLHDHVFCESAIARRAFAETMRYIIQLSRGVKTARASHGLQGRALTVRVSWD